VAAARTPTPLGPVELEYYLRSGTPSSSLLGLALHGGPRDGNGVVRDVVIATGGDVEAFAVSHGGRTRRVALAETRVRWAEGRLLELSTGSPTSRADASDRMDAAAAAL
jgi:hypothetical protein